MNQQAKRGIYYIDFGEHPWILDSIRDQFGKHLTRFCCVTATGVNNSIYAMAHTVVTYGTDGKPFWLKNRNEYKSLGENLTEEEQDKLFFQILSSTAI